MPAHITHRRYLFILAAMFTVWWAVLAIEPIERDTWLLENVLVLVFALTLGSTYRAFPLSRISYTLIFVFLCLHEIGAHYTYARVPWNDWVAHVSGFSPDELLGFTRNHFDRAVHFSYGLLLAYPVREVFIRVAQVRGFWAYFLPLDITMSTSMLFELFEWGAAELVGGGLGAAYLGTQGDIWDAHKDMSLASLGAAVAMTATAAINISLHRDFASEWAESLRVKGRRPLGENAIRQMLRRLRAGRASSR
jgi:putative membrane protein